MNWEALTADFDPEAIEEPWGPVDHQVVCVGIEREGRPQAALVNFGLHPAILAGDNWLYSADYPGYLAEALARIHGEQFITLFLNGCCGDVNHIDYRDRQQGRGYQMTQRVGYVLAVAAERALRDAAPIDVQRLIIAGERVQLQRKQISEEQAAHCRQVLTVAEGRQERGRVDGHPEVYFAQTQAAMALRQHEPDHVELMTLRLGPLSLVGLPGEAFCELGLAVKRDAPTAHTIVTGLTNDAIGYLPTKAAFQQGGYEATAGSTFYEPGAGERLVEAALEQLNGDPRAAHSAL